MEWRRAIQQWSDEWISALISLRPPSRISKEYAYELVKKALDPSRISDRRAAIDVHTSLCHSQVLHYLYAAKTLAFFSDLPCHFVAYNDGSLTNDDVIVLRMIVPEIRIISTDDIVPAVSAKKYHYCNRFLHDHILGPRIIGMLVFADTSKFLLMDSDVLFFSKAERINQWYRSGEAVSLYNKDSHPTKGMSLGAQDFARLGIEMPYFFNAGLVCAESSRLNIEQAESLFGYLYENYPLQKMWLWDQTVFAALFCSGANSPLPDGYAFQNEHNLLFQKPVDQLVSKHYSFPKGMLFSEGVNFLFTIKAI